MFNTKNIIIIFISAIISSLITWAMTKSTSLGGMTSLLFNAFVALILMQFLQNVNLASIRKSVAKISPKKTADSLSNANRETGTVKWFDSGKGYGFITRTMGEDIFVHFRSIKKSNGYRSLREGQAVEFTVTKGAKGPQAEDIHIVQ